MGGYQFGGAIDETVKHEGTDFVGESLGIKGSEFAGAIFNYRLGPKLLVEFAYDRQFTTLDYHDAKDKKYFYDSYEHTLNSYMTQIHFMIGVTVGL